MKKLKFWIGRIGFYLLRISRANDGCLVLNSDISKIIYDKTVKRGRATVLVSFNIQGGERQVMVGDLRFSDLNFRELQKLTITQN